MPILTRFLQFVGSSVGILYVVTLGLAGLYWAYVAVLPEKKPQQQSPGPAAAASAPRHQDLILMNAVRAVSADAAMQMHSPYASYGIDDPIACRLAKRFEAEPGPKHSSIAKQATEFRVQCDITQLSRELTRTTFENIAAMRALPSELYAFEVFQDGEWKTVGLFKEEGLCREVREKASSRGVGTKICSKWAPRF